jgi:hypothetical protein
MDNILLDDYRLSSKIVNPMNALLLLLLAEVAPTAEPALLPAP